MCECMHIAAEEGGAPTTNLRLSLLSREMHAARVADYTAPSYGGGATDTSMPPPSKPPKQKGKRKEKGTTTSGVKTKQTKQKGPALAEVNQASAEAAANGPGGGVKRKMRSTRSGPASA